MLGRKPARIRIFGIARGQGQGADDKQSQDEARGRGADPAANGGDLLKLGIGLQRAPDALGGLRLFFVIIRQCGLSGAVAIRAIRLGRLAFRLGIGARALPCRGGILDGFLGRSIVAHRKKRALDFVQVGHVVVIPERGKQRGADGALHRPLAGGVYGDQHAVGHVPGLAGRLRGNQLGGR